MNNNARSISISDLVFLICLFIIDGSFMMVLLFTSFSIAFGVTDGNIDITLIDVEKINLEFIKILFSVLILNISLIVTYPWIKSWCNNTFFEKKTIGEMMKEK